MPKRDSKRSPSKAPFVLDPALSRRLWFALYLGIAFSTGLLLGLGSSPAAWRTPAARDMPAAVAGNGSAKDRIAPKAAQDRLETSPPAPVVSQAKPGSPTNSVHVSDLDGKVTVIGVLGCPIREMVDVEGVWFMNRPGGIKFVPELRFRVEEVNHTRLAKPVVFPKWAVQSVGIQEKTFFPTEGVRWMMRGYETGGYRGLPDSYTSEFGRISQLGEMLGFVPEFCFATVRVAGEE